ncbi:hypothetical protein HYC85_010475 [Camellia sinensis]|uniref:NADH:quinone oxidoreductase/Mrp antiporter transmembrane domain-containing protein n=1 Tax=Camellia sinensis TaxID=4442 RepID=A0A7J7HJW0_CAMSI|nr:hypothetical protein HYC85_010475 [Camellia sinensis]
MAITEFFLFVLTTTLGGMFLCGANDLITIFVAPECFSLCSYLLSGYTKKDVWSNEATLKYLLMGGASSSILVHGFSWLYGSSGREIELQEIVNGLINTQMYNSPGISIALIFITVGIGFKLSPAPSHQWTPDVYEGVRNRMDSVLYIREEGSYSPLWASIESRNRASLVSATRSRALEPMVMDPNPLMSRISRKSDSIDGIWYDTYEIDDIDEIYIQIFLLRTNSVATIVLNIGRYGTYRPIRTGKPYLRFGYSPLNRCLGLVDLKMGKKREILGYMEVHGFMVNL